MEEKFDFESKQMVNQRVSFQVLALELSNMC